jgi:MFS family permease
MGRSQYGMSPKKILEVRIPLKELAPAVILVFNSIVWFTLIVALFNDSIQKLALPLGETLILHGMYYAGIAISAIFGAMLFPRARENYLQLWMLFGAVMTALLTTIQSNPFTANIFVCLLLGTSIGIGLPSTLSYFADTTAVENRGTYGGLTWSTVGFGTLALALAINVLDPFLTFMALAIWRATGIVLFAALSRLRGKLPLPSRVPSYRSILTRYDVALYLLPWIMFSLVNFAESPILGKVFGDLQLLVGFIEFAISGIFAVVGGILGDLVGRKRIVITGFVILGIEYAFLSLFSGTQVSLYVYILCDGVTWGMFASVFFMTLWGDLSETGQKEKYYVLGGLPYLLSSFLIVIVKPFVTEIETATAFSLASFFLFLAVLPLLYAPETLPEKRIKERELRKYVEKAKKTKEKYA